MIRLVPAVSCGLRIARLECPTLPRRPIGRFAAQCACSRGAWEPAGRGMRPSASRADSLAPPRAARVQGFGWAIAKQLAEAGAEISLGVWVPALNIFETSYRRGKFDESRKLSDGSLMEFKHIYPMDAVFDTPDDVPEDVRAGQPAHRMERPAGKRAGGQRPAGRPARAATTAGLHVRRSPPTSGTPATRAGP